MNKVQKALQARFDKIHPLIFARSMQKAKSDGELFDILSTIPTNYPIVWNQDKKSWVRTEDLLQSKKFTERN